MTKQRLDKLFGWLTFLMLVLAAVLTFSNTFIASDINGLQAKLNDGKFYPVLTILTLLVPYIIIALPVKMILLKKAKQDKSHNTDINYNKPKR